MSLADDIEKKGNEEIASVSKDADAQIQDILDMAISEAERIIAAAHAEEDRIDLTETRRVDDRHGAEHAAVIARAKEEIVQQIREKSIAAAEKILNGDYARIISQLAALGAHHIKEKAVDLNIPFFQKDIFEQCRSQIISALLREGISVRNAAYALDSRGGIAVISADGRRLCTLTLEENFRRIEDEVRKKIHGHM